MRKLLLTSLILFLTVSAHAQVVCTQLGAFTDCSGPGIDQTQVRTGPNTGVIMTPYDTMPYTFLNPSRSTFDPTPLPSLMPELEP